MKKHDKSTSTPVASNGSSTDAGKKKNGEEGCSFSSVAAAITDEIFTIAVRQEESHSEKSASSGATKQTKGKNNQSSKQQQQPPKKQPLFAAVIQKWFLEERMKARGVTSTSKSNKKKKRKKKKKGTQASNDAGADNTADEESAMISLVENGATLPSTTESSAAASSSTASKKFDCILDKFIDQQIEGIDDHEKINIGEGRDLQAFTTFLGQKFESYLEEQQSQKTAKDTAINKSALLWDYSGSDCHEVLPTILMADVNNNAQQAKCACGHAIRSHLNTWSDKYQSVKQRIVLEAKFEDDENDTIGYTNKNEDALSIPVCSNYLDADTDDPFAYGALIDDEFDIEAGASKAGQPKVEGIKNENTSLRLELRQISSPPTNEVRYLQVDPVCTHDVEGGKYVYPIDEQSILNLVERIIVPNSIDNNEHADDECDLNDKDMHFIKDRAESSENEFLHQFFDMLRLSESAKTKLNAAREEHARRTIFDPKTSVGLRGADEQLNLLLNKIVQFLIRVTKYSCCVGWFSEKPAPISIVAQLWNEFENLLVALVKPALKVRGTEIQVNRRPGKVPQAFCNTAVRNCHDQLVCLKIDKIDRLLYLLRSEFLNRPDCTSSNFLKTNIPSQMLRLCVLEAYSMRKHEISADDVFSNEESLKCLNEMFNAKIGLPQVNYHITLRAVERSERDRAERFKLAYKKVVEIVTKADAHLTCQSLPDVASLVSGAELYESKRLDYELEEKNPSQSTSLLSLDYEDNPTNVNMEEDITRSLNKSGALWMQWVYTLCMENYSISPTKKFRMNRELEVYMNGQMKNPCEGGGERKVSVILATLIYRWLEAKYNEWHAEMTREELLQEAMELTAPPLATKGGAGKKSKKKKSKKKKKAKEESTETSQTENQSNIDIDDTEDAGADIVAAENEEIEEPVTPPIMNDFTLDGTLHSSEDVGWTTVGVNTNSENDAKINEEIDTARDEEIARALQEQYREEAKGYDAENIVTPSTRESSVEIASPLVLEKEKDGISSVPDSATKFSEKAKINKLSETKAKQTCIVETNNNAGDVTAKDEGGTNGVCFETHANKTVHSQREATPHKKLKAAAAAKDDSLKRSDDDKADKSVDLIQIEVKIDKAKKATTIRDDGALTSDDAKAEKSIAPKSHDKALKKKQVAAQAAVMMGDELSTSDCDNSVNSAATSCDKAEKKQEIVTPQAAAKQTNNHLPKVGVYDGDQYIDAETYLVGRMKKVQKKLVWL